jgi:hypothetical protein
MNSKCRFLTVGEPLPPLSSHLPPGWLILSPARGGIPELLAPCWEGSTFRWRLCERTPLYGFCHFSLISRVPFSFDENWGTKVTTHRAPYGWKALIWRGAAWCPEGIINDTAIITPSVMQPSAWYLTPWLRWTRALFAVQRHYSPPWWRHQVLAFGEAVTIKLALPSKNVDVLLIPEKTTKYIHHLHIFIFQQYKIYRRWM